MPKPTWEVLIYDSPAEREKWRALCGLFRDIDIQYFPEYAYLFELNGDGAAHCFVYRQSDDALVLYPFLKRRINAIPGFSDLPDQLCDITVPYGYGGYLRSSDAVDMADFYAAFQEYCRQNQVVSEFVRFHPLLANQRYAPPAVPVQKWNDTVAMDLSQSEENLWQNLASACRNKVRKAKRAGVRLVMDEACRQLESFHALYSATMNRLEAAPYYLFPLRWFKSLVDLLPNHVVLANAVVGDDLIASSLFLFGGSHMHYFLSGSDAELHRLCPNNLLLYEAALWGKRRGFTCLHLGGGQLPDDSLYRFKSSFSPIRVSFFIGSKIHHPAWYSNLSARVQADRGDGIRYGQSFPVYRSPTKVLTGVKHLSWMK